ncbi:MAG: hypothetical protein MUF18_00760 [Fimbriiglobus sp.]|nr:hypothetical protein [Fimbriiglobus sp.]
MSKSCGNGVRLGCERLETRENPAGNVMATVLPGGYLYVRGDAADNLVSIQQNAVGDIIIYGVAGTTVNGLSAAYMGTGWLNGVFVVSDAGNDLIKMIGVRVYDIIQTQMGNENDGLALYGVSANRLIASMEGGDDVVAMDGVYVGQYAYVLGGTGYDTVDYRTFAIAAGFYYTDVERQVGGPYGY